MALFKKSDNQNSIGSSSIITHGSTIIGNIIGNDSIHIEGEIHGDVKVNNIVFIGKNAKINGNIKANQVISSGECNGNIICNALEFLESSITNGNIKTNKMLVKGNFQGNIICSGLFIDYGTKIEANVQAKNVIVGGCVEGVLACKSLKITKDGHVKAQIYTDNIENNGGILEGSIGSYADFINTKPELRRYAEIFNSLDEAPLLEYNDYYVNIDEEIHKTNISSDNDKDEFIDVTYS